MIVLKCEEFDCDIVCTL